MQAFALPGIVPQRPGDTALGRFFKHSYRVGAEKFMRDIPTLVLLEILAVLLLVIRNGILGLFGEHIPGSDPTYCIRCSWRPHYVSFIPLWYWRDVRRGGCHFCSSASSLFCLVADRGHHRAPCTPQQLAGWMIFIVIPAIAFGIDVALSSGLAG